MMLRAELIKRLAVARTDPGLRADLAELARDTTDDLGSFDDRPAGVLDTTELIATATATPQRGDAGGGARGPVVNKLAGLRVVRV